MAIDLVTVSVLLDAGAGNAWRYREAESGPCFAARKGWRLQALICFAPAPSRLRRTGPIASTMPRLHASMRRSWRAIFRSTRQIHWSDWRHAQRSCAGSARALGERGDLFGCVPARPGNLVDYFTSIAEDGSHSGSHRAHDACSKASHRSGRPAWCCDGIAHRGCRPSSRGPHRRYDRRIVPFHKLSQWLTYSLIEPFAGAGLKMRAARRAHGAAGISQRRASGRSRRHSFAHRRSMRRRPTTCTSELIVEWRALTVALMDRLLDLVRAKLGLGSPSPCRTCCKAGPGARDARSRVRCARPMAPRRSRSPPTARCSEIRSQISDVRGQIAPV